MNTNAKEPNRILVWFAGVFGVLGTVLSMFMVLAASSFFLV